MQVIHLVKTVKLGTGISINIPVEYLRALNIRRGDYLVLALHSGDTFLARKPTDQELFDLKPKDIQYGL
jgi:antitoxin component of MazEF toxin-antitoxin module